MLSNGSSTIEKIEFNEKDIKLLLDSHIPIFIKSQSRTAKFIIPIILQLEGPFGNFINFFNKK